MDDDALHQLSRRERECLALVGLGYRSGEIAGLLQLSSGTVDNYIKAAGRKVGITDRKLLARRLREYDPEGIQKIVQRLDIGQKTVAPSRVTNTDQPRGLAANGAKVGQMARLAPSEATLRKGRKAWEKLLLALVIAVGTSVILRVLVYFSTHSLRDLPVLH